MGMYVPQEIMDAITNSYRDLSHNVLANDSPAIQKGIWR